MKKKFNITGPCLPNKHYMVDTIKTLDKIKELIAEEDYFSIHRPRQYGKTTLLHFLHHHLSLSNTYCPIVLNFQGVDRKWYQSDDAFAKMFAHRLFDFFEYTHPEIAVFINKQQVAITDMDALSKFITRLVRHIDAKIVLLIDEVDAAANYEPFLSFLGMLRTKYLARTTAQHATFHSIILAGVYDIKSLKYKLRDPESAKYNSPWNIAIDFEEDLQFTVQEISSMLTSYSQAEGVTMDVLAVAEMLYYHTSGHPFLVSKLCKNIAEKILPKQTVDKQKTWTILEVEESVQLLLKENNTNFDSLIGNLENHPKLFRLVYEVIINGAHIPFNSDEPITQLGRTYGIFKENGRLKIHNRIYEQRLYNYLAAKKLQDLIEQGRYSLLDDYVIAGNRLDMEQVLLHFQQFMKEQRSHQDQAFIEREWRLIFLAFLKPIIQGKGYDFKEVEISNEKRLDIVVTFHQQKYILELKLWRGAKYHDKGLHQLHDYLNIHGMDKGYLLIFDTRKKRNWAIKTILHKGKTIYAVWV